MGKLYARTAERNRIRTAAYLSLRSLAAIKMLKGILLAVEGIMFVLAQINIKLKG